MMTAVAPSTASKTSYPAVSRIFRVIFRREGLSSTIRIFLGALFSFASMGVLDVSTGVQKVQDNFITILNSLGTNHRTPPRANAMGSEVFDRQPLYSPHNNPNPKHNNKDPERYLETRFTHFMSSHGAQPGSDHQAQSDEKTGFQIHFPAPVILQHRHYPHRRKKDGQAGTCRFFLREPRQKSKGWNDEDSPSHTENP